MVKVRRIHIENFKILKDVLGKDEITIEFSDNNMIIIIGKNGSGKSFLMSLFSPAPVDLLRNRSSNPAIPEKIGIKELDLELDLKYLYKIRIVYDSKTSCFIHKYNKYTNEDLGELNPNGNVNTYFDILDRELGWTKSYLNIGYLSNSVTNIISMKPADRSNYISIWLPQLGDFIDAYKVVSKKANIIKRQIDMLNQDIGKLSDTDYDILIDNYNKNITTLESKYHENLAKQNKTDAYIKITKEISKDDLILQIQKFKTESKLLNQERVELLDEKELLSKYSGKEGRKLLEDTLKKCGSESLLLSEKINNIDSNLTNIGTELNEIKADDTEVDEETYTSIESTMNSLKLQIDELYTIKNNILKNNPEYSQIEEITKSEIDIFKIFIDDLKDIRNKIVSLVDSAYLKDGDFIASSGAKIFKLKETYQLALDNLEDEILDITNKIYLLKNSNMSYMLKQRPALCTMTCGVISEIMKYVNPEEEINSSQNKLNKLFEEKILLNNKIDNVNEESHNLNLSLDLINEMNNKVFNKRELISKFPSYVKESFENPDMCSILNGLPVLCDKIDDYKEYIYLIDKISISESSQHNSAVAFELLKQKKNINEKWLKLHENYEKMSKDRRFLIDDFNRNENLEKRLKDINILNEQNIKRVEEYNKKADVLLEKQKYLKTISKNYYIYNSLKEVNDKLEMIIYQTKIELNEMNARLENVKTKKNSMATLMESRDNLLKRKKRYDILSDTWSPKIGYPAIQMEDWLDDLTVQTNSDLEKMWGSDLKIETFEIGANEFNIKINRNGTIIKDAGECSEGERATLSLAISFAVIEINIKYRKYNILRFDELDGPFDADRRKSFIEVLSNRLDDLDCGSALIISHNNEFGDIPADAIILSETDEKAEMVNKNIVFKSYE